MVFASLRVGWYLAVRQLKRSNVWATILIVCIMTLTFLNLVVVGGILVGLPVGATLSYNRQYSGDILFRSLPTKEYIDQSQETIKQLEQFPEVVAISARSVHPGLIEANYRTEIGPKENPDSVATQVTGIDPDDEQAVTAIGSLMLEGEMLLHGEEGAVLIGKNLLAQYTVGIGVLSATVLKNVETGSRVRIKVNGKEGEYIVKGVLGSKAGEVSTRVFMSGTELRRILGRTDQNVDEIAVRVKSGTDAVALSRAMRTIGLDRYARIETSREAQGAGLDDIEKTFTVLAGVIGAIGLMVASITVFIVIFINAITRRKYIGIMKGIGIAGKAIEISYVIQSLFYACIGSAIGLAIVYGALVPYFYEHPIDFPFADGILLVPLVGTLVRAGLLILVTIIAGYIPARMIVRQNTLDAILGR